MFSAFTDMTGRSVQVPDFPKRIVSLVPSQTELLYYLGLGNRIVGITRFCIHPAHARQNATVIGGTKNIDPDRVLNLAPDLVIGNKEENDRPSILALESEVPVWLSDIFTLEDAIYMIRTIGRLCHKEEDATRLAEEILLRFQDLALQPDLASLRVLYLIWANPWMGVGRQTFIHHMLSRIGLVNVLEQQTRYPVVSEEALATLSPELVFLSSEPFPFKYAHEEMIRHALPESSIFHVDGEMFSWYGNRLLHVPAYLSALSTRLTDWISSR